MKKAIERVVCVLKGVSTLDIMIKKSKIILLLLISMTALVGGVRGGHSTLDLVDPSFNPQIQTYGLGYKTVQQIIPLPNGKALVAGNFNSYNRQPAGAIARLNADGTLDTTFNCNLPDPAWVIRIALQTNGKIIVLIFFDEESFQFVRLNADGSADPTFDFTFGANEYPRYFTIDASDRILLSGNFYDNNDYRSIIRLNPDGLRDSTFQFPSAESTYAVETQNNKIIITSQVGIQRLNEDGTIDSSFITRNLAGSLIVQPDLKLLILTSFSQGVSSLRRLNENGSDDTGFTSSTFPSPGSIALGEDGRIALAVRTQNSSDYQIRRLLADGTADSSFTPYIAARFNALALQADGGVLVGDRDFEFPPLGFRNDFVRLLPNGSPDPAFNTGIGFQNYFPGFVGTINVQPDQKILIGGGFHFVNEVPRRGIARLNADSTLDPTFQISTGGTANYFSQIWSFSNIRTQSDGKIVVSGDFSYIVNGVTKFNLVRLNSDGSIDPTFILGVPIASGTTPLVTYNDGKLLVGTSRSDPSQPPFPVKLLATGARDTSFNANIYPQDSYVWVKDVAVQLDGKVIIGGHRISLGVRKSFLTRLNADGSLDTTFQSREHLDQTVTAFVLLPNGKIVIAEVSSTASIPPQSNVLRLNPDGSVDPTFDAGTGANGQVNAMLLLSTGRILVGGIFTSFNGQPRGNLVQLNAAGSVFTPVYKINGTVWSLAVDINGRVFVGGDFTTIIAGNSSATRTAVAGLIDAPPTSTRFDFDGDLRADLGVFSAADGMWSIRNSLNYQSVWTNFGLSGDKTVPADFDGDSRTDTAVFRPSEGIWYLLRSQEGFGAVQWGADGDKPIAGDFDGDWKADLAVWRPSTGVWWILKSSDGEASIVKFGLPGDLPLSHADFDGDRKTDIAVWRPSDGNFYWLASGSNNQFNAVHFGTNGDIPAVADYNGDGKADLVVYRPSEGNWYQYLSAPNGEYTFTVVRFGMDGDEPITADYDGDGKTDIAVRRGNQWHILHSALGYSVQIFGDADAQAIAAFSRW
jgi:uncharacterized delta-60 repeat protein